MTRRERYEDEILAVLAKDLDEVLHVEGFQRADGQRVYQRKARECSQSISFHFEVEPRDAPDKNVLIRPKLQIKMPALSKIACEITHNHKLILPAPDIFLAIPLTPNLLPDVKIGWFANDMPERKSAIHSGCKAITSVGLAFLNNLTTIADLVRLYESQDKRLKLDNRMTLFVAAALLETGRKSEACTLVQQKFGKGAMARHYSDVLKNVCHKPRL